MIEIILRKDIQDYEPKPLFGYTYRQVVTGVAIAAACTLLGVGLSSVGVTGTLLVAALVPVGMGIGFAGVGNVHGLKPEKWWAIARADREWPRVALFSAPRISPAAERINPGKRHLTRKERRIAKADRADAAAESEMFTTFE